MDESKRPALIPYESEDGSIKLDVQLDGDTVWLPQEQLSGLYGTTQQNISQHINNIYAEDELNSEQTHKKKLLVVDNGRRYAISHYNLDVVISVGYRVNSVVATRFRQWATQTLEDHWFSRSAIDQLIASGGLNSAVFLAIWAQYCTLHSS